LKSTHPLVVEWLQIGFAASLSGPCTWPLAALLIQRQLGNFEFSFFRNLKTNGIRAAYSGCLPYASYKLFGIGTQRGIQSPVLMYLNGQTSINFSDNTKYTIAGICSGLIGGFIVTPIEQAKISLANRQFPSLSSSIRFFSNDLVAFRTLFAGAQVTMWRNVVFDSVNALLYNNALKFPMIDRGNVMQMACINAVAGVLTAVIDYPLDVLKTRIQTSAIHDSYDCTIQGSGVWKRKNAVSLAGSSQKGILAVAREMIRQEGVRSLYFGLQQKLGLYFYVWFVYGIGYSAVGKVFQ
jgi:hypothetical protein